VSLTVTNGHLRRVDSYYFALTVCKLFVFSGTAMLLFINH